MSVNVCVLVRVCEHLDVWGELASHIPLPQFSRLGIQVSLAIYACLSGSWLGGLPFFSFLFPYASVLSIYMYSIYNTMYHPGRAIAEYM